MLRVPSVCFLGALLVSAAALRSADQDKWWPDYAGGPASARYFEATQITRANVSRLAIAWTYPYGETNSNPLVCCGRLRRSAAPSAAATRCTRSAGGNMCSSPCQATRRRRASGRNKRESLRLPG